MAVTVVESEFEVHIAAAFFTHLPYGEKVAEIIRLLEDRARRHDSPPAAA